MYTHSPYQWAQAPFEPWDANSDGEEETPFSPTQPSWSGRLVRPVDVHVDVDVDVDVHVDMEAEEPEDHICDAPSDDGAFHVSPPEEELLFGIVGLFQGYPSAGRARRTVALSPRFALFATGGE